MSETFPNPGEGGSQKPLNSSPSRGGSSHQVYNMGDASSPDRQENHSQSIFMTNLPKGSGARPESPQSISEYTRLFAHLMALADNIDSHYRQQLSTHESDFKRAYEGQM